MVPMPKYSDLMRLLTSRHGPKITCAQSDMTHRPHPCHPAAEAEISHAAPVTVDNSVILHYNGLEEKLRLVNNKVQLSAVKDAFNLKTIKLDGRLEPADQLGFTVAEFKPGQTVQVSGSPSAGVWGRCGGTSGSSCRPGMSIQGAGGGVVCFIHPSMKGGHVSRRCLHRCDPALQCGTLCTPHTSSQHASLLPFLQTSHQHSPSLTNSPPTRFPPVTPTSHHHSTPQPQRWRGCMQRLLACVLSWQPCRTSVLTCAT